MFRRSSTAIAVCRHFIPNGERITTWIANGEVIRESGKYTNVSTCYAIKMLLRHAGIESVCINDPREAIEVLKLERQRVSGIVIDNMMPGMSGIEFMTVVRGHPHFEAIPMIM